MKRTFIGKQKKACKKLGFRARSSTPGGRNVLRSRRSKGRYVLSK